MMTTHFVAAVPESPEFESMCAQKSGAYSAHPASQKQYIQCDQFGKAFVHSCPTGTIFTENMACEQEAHLLPTLSQLNFAQSAYGGLAAAPSMMAIQREEPVMDSPEWKHMCKENRVSNDIEGMFFVAHPQDVHHYIQCDEHGRAFLKMCPGSTVFTENMACEQSAHLLPKGLRGAMHLDVGLRVPQFNARCESLLGKANVIYFVHPQRGDQFIQCDSVGNAFLKTCPSGLLFGLDDECVFPHQINQINAAESSSSPYSTNQQPAAPETPAPAPAPAPSYTQPETTTQAPYQQTQTEQTEAPAPAPAAPAYKQPESSSSYGKVQSNDGDSVSVGVMRSNFMQVRAKRAQMLDKIKSMKKKVGV